MTVKKYVLLAPANTSPDNKPGLQVMMNGSAPVDCDETWSRLDDKDVTATHSYSMDGAPDLLWVRVNSKRSSSCSCSDLAASNE